MDTEDLITLVDDIMNEPDDLEYVRRKAETIDLVGDLAWSLAYAIRMQRVRERVLFDAGR